MQLSRLYVRILILAGLFLLMSACAIHSTFPFICFRPNCAGDVFETRGLKKRLKVKMMVMNRKLNKKQAAKAKHKSVESVAPVDDRDDSDNNDKGNCVDYYKFTLLFSLKQHPGCYDSIIVEYTGQHRRLTDYSESHLYQMLDTIANKDIVMVLIKNTVINPKQEDANILRTRTRPIRRLLQRTGVSRSKIKVLAGDAR